MYPGTVFLSFWVVFCSRELNVNAMGVASRPSSALNSSSLGAAVSEPVRLDSEAA